MAINCKQQDRLLSLPIQQAGLPNDPYVTLTELACCAIYGTPLTAGPDGSLAKLRSAHRWTKLMLLGPPNNSSAVDIVFSTEPDALDVLTRIDRLAATLNGGIPDWLEPLFHAFIGTGQKIETFMEWFAVHGEHFEALEKGLFKRSRQFYGLLSHAVAGNRVVLFGRRHADASGTGSPHEPIDDRTFIVEIVHDLDANELSEPSQPAGSPAPLSGAQTKVANHLSWIDVKISLDHANMLLHEFKAKPESVCELDPMTVQNWNPTWISLPCAVMWAVTGDKQLAMAAERQWKDTGGFLIGIHIQLAYREAETGKKLPMYLKIDEAWPTLRALIADEKIIAEGRSIERRGLHGRLETVFPNQQIPSGDASNLVILSDVPGIAPKDALGADEHYRFHDGQGRYWYDVRLRASDVFTEFRAARSEGSKKTPKDHKPSRRSKKSNPVSPPMRPSYQKIHDAVVALSKAAKPIDIGTLRPVERNRRLSEQMKQNGLKPIEIPGERTFRAYFNHGPGKVAKRG